ncbi:uncharacterized protein [Apostichopus japonicus]|uniref:uncharacterized protein n=1 Tax=Stichopus japonicus TaxID=307972 RepID=UPI003AB48F09
MAPPHSNYHVQGVPARKGAGTVLSHRSEPTLRSTTRIDLHPLVRSSSSASLPSLKTSRQVLGINLGVNANKSAIRSLANNPKLNVNIVNGGVSVLRRNTPTGSPTGNASRPEKNAYRIVPLSKEGYHPRSRSPTYQTLILANSQLECLLSRRLREIRRDLEGQKARQNSAVFGEVWAASPESEDHWYVDAVEADHDSSAIETTRLSNEDYATSLETICTSGPMPHRTIKFSSNALKENICNNTILGINESDTQAKLEVWKKDHATNIPKLERLDSSPILRRRQCLADVSQATVEERFLFLRRTSRSVEPVKTKSYKKTPKQAKTKQVIVEEPEMTPKPTYFPPKPENRIPEIKPQEPAKPVLVINADEAEEIRKSLPYFDRPEKEGKNVLKEDVASNRVILSGDNTIDQSQKPMNSIDPTPVAVNTKEVTGDSTSEPLTAKEKFIRMQERMKQRKQEKQKTRESFADYSFMMYNQSKDREGRGGEVNKLGMTLSKRLENMSTFNSRISDDSDSDEDDDDDDDDDNDDIQLGISDSEDDVN